MADSDNNAPRPAPLAHPALAGRPVEPGAVSLRALLRSNTAGRLMFLVVLLILAAALLGWRISASASPAAAFRLTSHGHSCFSLRTPGGVELLLDPFGPQLGYPLPQVAADLVLISHDHFDHNNAALATGTPVVLRGVDGQTRQFVPLQHRERDVLVRNVAASHDPVGGKERGPDSIWVIEASGVRIVHLGDLGQELTREQLTAIGPVDVLLVPVGGTFTLDAKGAKKVVAQLSPRRFIVPMHHATPSLKMKLPLAPLQPFLAGMTGAKRRLEGPTLQFDAQPEGRGPEVVVFGTP